MRLARFAKGVLLAVVATGPAGATAQGADALPNKAAARVGVSSPPRRPLNGVAIDDSVTTSCVQRAILGGAFVGVATAGALLFLYPVVAHTDASHRSRYQRWVLAYSATGALAWVGYRLVTRCERTRHGSPEGGERTSRQR